ncbi:MAG: redoxin domain-containing protein [Firmicutes bacterium]|nr:redoxin domain-containing protein [Bacillota bacterium]
MNRKLKAGLGIAGFVLLIVAAVVAYNALRDRAPGDGAALTPEQSAADRQKAPDFMMTDSDGNTVKLSDLLANGKPVVLNFWASWCDPCKSEMPEFETVYKDLGNDVQFVMLNMTDGQRETTETAAAYVAKEGYTFPVFFDTERQAGAYAYGIRAIPTTFFIDQGGYIVSSWQSTLTEQTLRDRIDALWKT